MFEGKTDKENIHVGVKLSFPEVTVIKVEKKQNKTKQNKTKKNNYK